MKGYILIPLLVLTAVAPSISRVAHQLDKNGPLELVAQLSELLQPLNLNSYRSITPDNRTLCPETPENPAPPNRIDTSARRVALRAAMRTANVDAYVMYNADQHLIGKPHFQRIQYISGFSGGSGYGAITHEKAAVWVDGRYFLQSDNQMDCDWIQMKIGEPGYPSLGEWLASVIGTTGTIAGDSKYISTANWETIDRSLQSVGTSLKHVDDLFDFENVWENRPELLNEPLIIHEMKFAGKDWKTKLGDVRTKMAEQEADVLVLASLDDIAWLFNLRGTDQPRSPLFDSFALIKENNARLYLREFGKLIEPVGVQTHLDVKSDGNCNTAGANCIQVKEYSSMLDDLQAEMNNGNVQTIWVSDEYNYAIYNETEGKRYVARSPIQMMKTVKNSVEIENYRKCQVRDSAAVVEFAAHLEESIKNGDSWTELGAAQALTEIRSRDENFIMVSFDPISGAGANAAIIHYRPDNDTDSPITTDGVYLLDSGGNYLDGTTDVTRTFHFGEPIDVIKEAYTRVLIGHIELDSMIWPSGLYGSDIDAVSRAALWANGWDFQHGTGHGIGYALNVHEGPGRILMGFSPIWEPLQAGMFLSDEPGYYEAGKYGIRLENIFEVVKADTPNNFAGKTYLGFRAATLVPYEPNLIKYEMLNAKQRRWLNTYNQRVLAETGIYLSDNNKQQAYNWLTARTAAIKDEPIWETDSATNHKGSLLLAALSVVIAHALIKVRE